MSGIAGIVDLRGELVVGSIDLDLLQRMAERLRHRGPDGVSFWSGGPVGLAFAAMHTTPEAELEAQPHADEPGHLRVVFDGRLDDREALRKQLIDYGQRPRQDTDAELVLCAYQAWGENCAAHLLGDFALAIWDSQLRQLYCARDILGLRPFYYSLTSNHFLCGSEPRALLEAPEVSREPNEAVVAEHLSCNFQSNEETLFRGILRLAPAHQLTLSARGLRLGRYWTPNPARSIRYGTDSEYAEHFLEVFRTAVHERLRVNRPAGAFLSGGMDSSSIVNVMLELLGRQERAPAELNTFSMVFPGELSDESAYIKEMQALWNHSAHLLTPVESAATKFSSQAARDMDFPGYPNGDLVFDPLRELARSMGIRVLMSGMGGDEWFTGSLLHYADYLKQLELGKFVHQLAVDRGDFPKDRREAPVVMPRSLVLQKAVMPLLPQHARQWIRKALGRMPTRPPIMTEALWTRVASQRPVRNLHEDPLVAGFNTHAQKDMAAALVHSWMQHTIEMLERRTAQDGMEFRFPFEDRRVIEFGLALPEDQRWRGPWTKFVLREAMKGRLPESVRQRRTKSDFSALVVRSLLQLHEQGIFTNMIAEEFGWVISGVARDSARRLAQSFQQGTEDYTRDFWPLWMAAAIELWVRSAYSESGSWKSRYTLVNRQNTD